MPINPDPLIHVLGTTLTHYAYPDAQAVAFAQAYSFKADIKKFGQAAEMAAVTNLTQLHYYQVYNPVGVNSLSSAKCKMEFGIPHDLHMC